MEAFKARQVLRCVKNIEGWFTEEAGLLFAMIDRIQKEQGIVGDLFEIGAHHGKSAVMLASMARPAQESLGVCDLFGSQEGNVSRSGSGDRTVFERNMAAYVRPQPRITVFERNSKNLRASDIASTVRFFHIDGGHDADEAWSDLNLAAQCMTPRGAILVDDAFKPEWPGVTEGIIRFLDSHPDFCATLLGFGKLLITSSAAAQLYRAVGTAEFRSEYGLGFPWLIKTLSFAGHPVLIFHSPPRYRRRFLKIALTRCYYRNAWLRGESMAWLSKYAKRIVD